jgi:hypothetical protein
VVLILNEYAVPWVLSLLWLVISHFDLVVNVYIRFWGFCVMWFRGGCYCLLYSYYYSCVPMFYLCCILDACCWPELMLMFVTTDPLDRDDFDVIKRAGTCSDNKVTILVMRAVKTVYIANAVYMLNRLEPI